MFKIAFQRTREKESRTVFWADFQMSWKTALCLIGIAVVLVLVPFMYWSRSQNPPNDMRRYKVEATLMLDGKPYEASRVWAVSCLERLPKAGSIPAKVCRFRAEALDIDLKDGGHLFLLLRQSSPKGEVSFWPPDQALARAIIDSPGKQTLPERHLPMLIYAPYPSDPMTVKHVSPQALNTVLGARSAVLSVNVEPSFEKPSPAVISRSLPWLKPGVVLKLKKDQAYNGNVLEYIDFERKY